MAFLYRKGKRIAKKHVFLLRVNNSPSSTFIFSNISIVRQAKTQLLNKRLNYFQFDVTQRLSLVELSREKGDNGTERESFQKDSQSGLSFEFAPKLKPKQT